MELPIYAVIMAGGSGTRFWPKSRHRLPKQLINFMGNGTLIRATLNRLEGLVQPDRVVVVTGKRHAHHIRRQLPEIPARNILVEPVGRNTAACLCLAAKWIQKQAAGEFIMLAMPADHLIQDTARFQETLRLAAAEAAADDCLVTLGIKPDHPETGYGYIIPGEQLGRAGVYKVKKFTEKPNRVQAQEMIARDNALWNSGIFIWRGTVIDRAFAEHLPETYAALDSILPRLGTHRQGHALRQVYPGLPDISIDYAVMEKHPCVKVIEAGFDWNDIGSWTALSKIFARDEQGNACMGEHIGLDSRQLVVYSPDKLVVTIGLDNVIIVDTKDALLICRQDRAQDVKLMQQLLKQKGLDKYL